MTFTSLTLQTLTADAESDISDPQFLIPILQEVDTILADLESRVAALETPSK